MATAVEEEDPHGLILYRWHVQLGSVYKKTVNGHAVLNVNNVFGRLGAKKRLVEVELIRDKSASPPSDLTKSCSELTIQPTDTINFIVSRPFKRDKKGQIKEKDKAELEGELEGEPFLPDEDSADLSDDDSLQTKSEKSKLVRKMKSVFKHNPVSSETLWQRHIVFQLHHIEIKSFKKNRIVLSISYKGSVREREMIFKHEIQAKEFSKLVINVKGAQGRAAEEEFKHMFNPSVSTTYGDIMFRSPTAASKTIKKSAGKKYLIEIMSAYDLHAADVGLMKHSSDPYCVVKVGHSRIHETSIKYKTLQPIWDLCTKSLFIFELKHEYLQRGYKSLLFEIMDYDLTKTNNFLGYVNVPFKDVIDGKNKRVEYNLEQYNKEKLKKGQLILKSRVATEDEIQFADLLYSSTAKSSSEAHPGSIPPNIEEARNFILKQYFSEKLTRPPSTFISPTAEFKRAFKVPGRVQRVASDGTTLYKVRPKPATFRGFRSFTVGTKDDPTRTHDVEYMGAKEVQRTAYEPSENWVNIGSGKIGMIYVEVLGCDGLPNNDFNQMNKNDKTDAFCVLSYEDAVISTNVIEDCLSPRFLPWTRRAFIFNMKTAQSSLYAAVFDHELVGAHEPIGRVTINIMDFAPDTEYVVTYKLHKTARFQRSAYQSLGTITLRMSVEYKECGRTLALDCAKIHSQPYINSYRDQDRAMMKFVLQGTPELRTTSATSIKFYTEELKSMGDTAIKAILAIVDIFFWRGYPSYIHSTFLFVVGIISVERPHLIPSLFFAIIAWIMLSLLSLERKHSSAWESPPSYFSIVLMCLFGTHLPPKYIKRNEVNENVVKAESERETEMKERIQKFKLYLMEQLEYNTEVARLSIENIKKKEIQKSHKHILTPNMLKEVQTMLGWVCNARRAVERILRWRFYYTAFWITTLCLILSIVCAFLPWLTIHRWIGRFFVWIFLSPLMHLVDVYYVQKYDYADEDVVGKRLAKALSLVHGEIEKVVQKRAAVKLMFGDNITALPRFMFHDFHRDYPIHSLSSATPRQRPKSEERLNISHYVMGNELNVDITPDLTESHPRHTEKDDSRGSFSTVNNDIEDEPNDKYGTFT